MTVFWIFVLVTATIIFVGYPFLRSTPGTERAQVNDEIEQEVIALRRKQAGGQRQTCARCGASLRAGDLFCGECGSKVNQGGKTKQ